ncbi:MAG: thiol-disulfide oxidoreductase DCC family protein [Maritimibacter sp.]
MEKLPKDIIVFDGVCLFCSRFARFIARHDRGARFRFVTAQSPLGQSLYRRFGLDPEGFATSIVIKDGTAFTKWAGFCVAMSVTRWPYRAAGALRVLPKGPADWMYDRFARNRYAFGRRQCEMPSEALRGRLIE